MTHLVLSDNPRISFDSPLECQVLAALLSPRGAERLESLNLSSCNLLYDSEACVQGLQEFFTNLHLIPPPHSLLRRSAPPPALSTLILNSLSLTRQTLPALLDFLSDPTRGATTHLRHLSLQGNSLSLAGCRAIKSLVLDRVCTGLQVLELNGNATREDIDVMRDADGDARFLEPLDESELLRLLNLNKARFQETRQAALEPLPLCRLLLSARDLSPRAGAEQEDRGRVGWVKLPPEIKLQILHHTLTPSTISHPFPVEQSLQDLKPITASPLTRRQFYHIVRFVQLPLPLLAPGQSLSVAAVDMEREEYLRWTGCEVFRA